MSGHHAASGTTSPSGDALYSHFSFGEDDGRSLFPAAAGTTIEQPAASGSADTSPSGGPTKHASPPTWQLETLRSRKQGECLNRLSERIQPLPGAAAGS